MTTCCVPIERGSAIPDDLTKLSLLTVLYTYWPDEHNKTETKSGEMHLFGDYDSLETQNFLLREVALRHPRERICSFTLYNQQP
jgi:hypothetical protein